MREVNEAIQGWDLTRAIFTGLAMGAALWASSSLAADTSNAVVAIVNGYLISDYDLGQRVELYAALSGMPAIDAVRDQILKSLEDEVMEMQEAARLKTSVEKADVDKELLAVSAADHLTPDQILAALAKAGVKPEVLGTQLRSRAIWRKMVMQRYGNDAPMTDEQLSDAMDVYLGELRRDAIVEIH